MKKILMLLFVVSMFIFPATSRAQGIESGQSMWNIYGGVGVKLQESSFFVNDAGAELGMSYLYFPTEYFGIGADLHYTGFQGSDTSYTNHQYQHWSSSWDTFETKSALHTLQLMATGRVNLNPGSQVRLYVPFGAGVVLTEGKMTYTWGREYTVEHYFYDEIFHEEYYAQTERDFDYSFGWYAGLGIEFDTSDRFSWGLEARYNSFRYDESRLAAEAGVPNVRSDTEHNYVSFLVKFSFK